MDGDSHYIPEQPINVVQQLSLRSPIKLLPISTQEWSLGIRQYNERFPFQAFTAIDYIRKCYRLGWFIEGSDFVGDLQQSLAEIPRVAIEIAHFYYHQGLFSKAFSALSRVRSLQGDPLSYFKDSDDPHDEALTCISVLSAYIGVRIDGLTNSGLRTLVSFDSWAAEPCMEDAVYQVGEPTLPNFRQHHYPATGPHMSRLSVFIVYWACKLSLDIAKEGLLEEEDTKKAARKRLKDVEEILRGDDRPEEELMLLELRLVEKLFEDNEDPATVLRSFLLALDESSSADPILRANALYSLAVTYLISQETSSYETASTLLDEARIIFRNENHRHAHTHIDYSLIHYRPDKTGSELERFRKLYSLAESFEQTWYIFGHLITILEIGSTIKFSGIDVYPDEFCGIASKLDRVLNTIGGKYFRQLNYMLYLKNSALDFEEREVAVWALKKLYEDPPSQLPPNHMGILASMISRFFSDMLELEQAHTYAQKAFEHFKRGKSFVRTSESAGHVAQSIIQLGISYFNDSDIDAASQKFERAGSLLQEWIQKDESRNNVQGKSRKYMELAIIEMYRSDFSNESSDSSDKAMIYIEEASRMSALCGDDYQGSIDNAKVQLLLLSDQIKPAIALTKKNINYWSKKAEDMPTSNEYALSAACANVRMATCIDIACRPHCLLLTSGIQFSGPILANISEETKAEYRDEAIELYRSAWWHMNTALELMEKIGFTNDKISWNVQLVDILAKLSKLVPDQYSREFYMEIVRRVEIAESIYSSFLQSLKSSSSLQSMLKRQGFLSSNLDFYSLYSSAIVSCLALNQTEEAWVWIQKAKARSLSSIRIPDNRPEGLAAAVAKNFEASNLINEEDSMVHAIGTTGLIETLDLDRRLRRHREQMSKNQAVMMAIRESYFILGSEDWLFQNNTNSWLNDRRVVFVDWYIPMENIDKDIYMFVRYTTGEVFSRRLSIRVASIERWIRLNLVFPTDRDPRLKKRNGNKLLRELNALVSPLAALTNADDLLVLSPSGILHDLPLHAMEISSQPLIIRNLIVYTSSLGNYRNCLIQAEKMVLQKRDTSPYSSFFTGVYETFDFSSELTATASMEERDSVYKCIERISNPFSGKLLVGEDVTPSSFKSAVTNQNWIHYHGHVHFSKSDILQQALVLSSDTKTEDTREDSTSGHLTISEIFDLNLKAKSPVVINIGCESGLQRITAGDETLGITTALLNAGAASTLGCLWPIPSVLGRFFSEKFYESLQQQQNMRKNGREGHENGTPSHLPAGAVNLAVAVRDAVRAIKERPERDMEVAYFWAPFALQGAWFARGPS